MGTTSNSMLYVMILIQGHRAPVAHIAMDSSQTLMATASADKTVKVWDIDGGYCTHSFSGHRYDWFVFCRV